MLIGSQLGERRQSRKTAARRAAAYREHKVRIEHDARQALEVERAERVYRFPDPATVLSIAAGPLAARLTMGNGAAATRITLCFESGRPTCPRAWN